MADLREKISRLQSNHTKKELLDKFASRTGVRATSWNPFTKAVFNTIAPEHTRDGYARRHDDFSEGLNPVEKHALALRLLLHEQIGAPLFDTRGQLKKLDYAEAIAAIDAYQENVPRGRELHIPTELPMEVDSFAEVSKRSHISKVKYEPVLEFHEIPEHESEEWIRRNIQNSQDPFHVYVLDCTPPIGDEEPAKITYQRRVAQSKMDAGSSYHSLSPIEKAAIALNENKLFYYVGMSNDVVDRIRRHNAGSGHHGNQFTHVYRPQRLIEIQGCSSTLEARNLEGERARELHAQDGIFVYSDNM